MTAFPNSAGPVSIVIVSRGRPEALARCLMGVSLLQYDPFEVIVVADPAGCAVARAAAFGEHLKIIEFDLANISAARNLGIAQAAGDVVAFIDDDAVPEPLWLHHLVAPSRNGHAAAMGGFVRGRNGISFQYKARRLDAEGHAHPIEVDETAPTILQGSKGNGVKTEGTNMAFTRDALVALGGFDEAYAYYLDETDLNMRLAATGYATAIVPLAEVHHGFAANAMRSKARVPTDLFDIGASWAVFQRKHIPAGDVPAHWARVIAGERRRLLRHLQAGTLEPRDIRRLMARLRAGYVQGQGRELAQGGISAQPVAEFRRFPAVPRERIVISARNWRVATVKKQARVEQKAGKIPTVMAFSLSSLYHRVEFDVDGFWFQSGGQFGKSERNTPIFQYFSLSGRVKEETKRVQNQRGLFLF